MSSATRGGDESPGYGPQADALDGKASAMLGTVSARRDPGPGRYATVRSIVTLGTGLPVHVNR